MATETDAKQQSTLTFFLWPRTLLGWIWVIKRMMFALTLGQVVDGSQKGTIYLMMIREGLSAITDYASVRNPIVSSQQSSPPNPPVPDETAK